MVPINVEIPDTKLQGLDPYLGRGISWRERKTPRGRSNMWIQELDGIRILQHLTERSRDTQVKHGAERKMAGSEKKVMVDKVDIGGHIELMDSHGSNMKPAKKYHIMKYRESWNRKRGAGSGERCGHNLEVMGVRMVGS